MGAGLWTAALSIVALVACDVTEPTPGSEPELEFRAGLCGEGNDVHPIAHPYTQANADDLYSVEVVGAFEFQLLDDMLGCSLTCDCSYHPVLPTCPPGGVLVDFTGNDDDFVRHEFVLTTDLEINVADCTDLPGARDDAAIGLCWEACQDREPEGEFMECCHFPPPPSLACHDIMGNVVPCETTGSGSGNASPGGGAGGAGSGSGVG